MHSSYLLHRQIRRRLFWLKWTVQAMFIGKRYPTMRMFWIAIAVILVWRGIWIIADALLFPNDILVSAIVSIGLGTLMLIIDDFRIDELR